MIAETVLSCTCKTVLQAEKIQSKIFHSLNDERNTSLS
jgi:hypothetical protein